MSTRTSSSLLRWNQKHGLDALTLTTRNTAIEQLHALLGAKTLEKNKLHLLDAEVSGKSRGVTSGHKRMASMQTAIILLFQRIAEQGCIEI